MTSNFVGGSSHISRVIWDLHQENVEVELPSGKHTKNYGKSQFLMGKLTISMAMFNSYVKLPEGIVYITANCSVSGFYKPTYNLS